jgi:hypothetical protein
MLPDWERLSASVSWKQDSGAGTAFTATEDRRFVHTIDVISFDFFFFFFLKSVTGCWWDTRLPNG